MSRKARAEVLYTLWQQMGHLALVEEQVRLALALIEDIQTCIKQIAAEQLRKGQPHVDKIRQLDLKPKTP